MNPCPEVDDDALFDFADEAPAALAENPEESWKLLIVDDEPEVHAVTSLALKGFRFDGKPLQLLHSYSGKEAVETLRQQPDIAIVLMDVVMETDHAGLDAVRAIRKDLGNSFVRIVLRTGQPGQAPEREIVTNYDINDYKEKTELTAKKLFTMVYTVLGYYRQLQTVDAHRIGLQKLVEELKRSNRDLNEFAYIASHDLAAPLRSITSFSQLIERRYSAALPEEAKEFLSYILQSTQRMKHLIDDLLALAQVGNRHKLATVSLDACLDRVLESHALQIAQTGAVIERQALPTLRGVETELRQMLANLLTNALKFHRPNVAPIIRFSAAATSGGFQLMVADNGIGIPPSERARLFQLFQRLHSQDEFEGTGIGLALCRKVAEGHGGEIHVEDSPLGGVSFVVTLKTCLNDD